jgi:hypothetical protein
MQIRKDLLMDPKILVVSLLARVGVSLATYNGDWAQAMAAAPAKGNLITVPAGTWPSPQIVPYAGLTIRGAGAGVSIVARNAAVAQDNNAIPTNNPVFKVNVANVAIMDLTIRGWPIASGPSDDILISGSEATGLRVQRVNLENAQGIGIQTQGPLGGMTGGLFEDITIANTLVRSNGAHGVALWLYKGTSGCTYRRITINGAVGTGIALDAGTSGDPNATSVDNNVFQDITISNTGGTLGGIMITLMPHSVAYGRRRFINRLFRMVHRMKVSDVIGLSLIPIGVMMTILLFLAK